MYNNSVYSDNVYSDSVYISSIVTMIKIKVSNQTYIILRPTIRNFITEHIPPDDVDIVIKDLIATYISELSGFNILEVMLTRHNKRNALFILPHRIYTTVGKASEDVYITGIFTFVENQVADSNDTLDANLSFIIGAPSEIIKLLNGLDKRGLKITAFMPPTKQHTNDNHIDFSAFSFITK